MVGSIRSLSSVFSTNIIYAAIRQSLVDDATYQTILDDLKATDPRKDLQDSMRGRSASQASWALQNDNYIKWKARDSPRVLWVHGNAGKGQSVIASSFVSSLERETKHQDGSFLAYFFCDEKDARRRSMRDVLKLLIRQMILKSRDLTEHLLMDNEQGKGNSRSLQNFDTIPLAALWRSLQSMVNDASVDSAYFLINAFDETEKESRNEFLQLIHPFLESEPSPEASEDASIVKFVFLSRSGRADIEKSLRQTLTICTEDEENAAFVNDGVKKEISGQVDGLAKLKHYNYALAYLVKRYVYEKADGNYIYAQLVVQELRNLEQSQAKLSTIRKYLEDLPYGLTDLFEFIRRRVSPSQSANDSYLANFCRARY